MSDFKTKMHQIRYRLGLRHRPRLQRSPDPVAGFGGPTSNGGGVGGEGRGGKGRGEGRERKGRKGEGLKPAQSKFSGYVAAETMGLRTRLAKISAVYSRKLVKCSAVKQYTPPICRLGKDRFVTKNWSWS